MTDEPFRGLNPVGGATGDEPSRSNQPVGQPEGITGYDSGSPFMPELSVDASQGTLFRGLFDTFQMGILDKMVELTRVQNPGWAYVYSDAETPIPDDTALGTLLDVAMGVATDINTNGYIPLFNGFVSGYSISLPQQIQDGQGLHFQIYRNTVATPCHIYITSGDNFTNPSGVAGGTKRTRIFNINPAPIVYDESARDVIYFKAGERISVAKVAMDLKGYTDADINYIQLQLHRVYDVITQNTLNALGIGGGNVGGVPGGGEEGEDPIEDPIVA